MEKPYFERAANGGVRLCRIQMLREFTNRASSLAMTTLTCASAVVKSGLRPKEIHNHLAHAVVLMDDAKLLLKRETGKGGD